MKILVIDNYDSFTYNLVHILRALGHFPDVIRNDRLTVEEAGSYDKILLSPGPGIPDEAGIMKDVIRRWAPEKSILGICLGHQGIAEVFGGRLFNIPHVLHGVTSQAQVLCADEYLFLEVPPVFQATHYHSWAVEAASLPADLEVTATNAAGIVMAVRHRVWDVRGLQFHPESVMTPDGPRMIANWLAHKTDTRRPMPETANLNAG
jgi:anthranilate synthase component 2